MADESGADFLSDQLQALLASPALARVANRHTKGSESPPAPEASIYDRDTLPSIDEQILRDALRLGLK